MKSKPMLLDKINEREKNYARDVIGLIGTHHGVGVTHTGLMLAFYMGEELGKKTAYLECNNHHDMGLIQSAYEWSREEALSFSFHRITCFKEVSRNRIADIFSDDFECFILDFGTDFMGNSEEFLRCGTKIVIGGQAEWDQQKLIHFIEAVRVIRGNETWLHLIPYANPKIIAKLKNDWKRKICAVPFQAEPTMPSKVTNQMFDEIFRFRGR